MSGVIVEKEKGSLRVILNRPTVHNAFDSKLIQRLTDIFTQAGEDSTLRSITLRGNGKSFCAGADLEYMKSMVKFSIQENQVDSEKLCNMFESIRNCEVPLITKVHGHAVGGGLGLLAVSDIVAAEKESRFAFSEARLGLVPAVISSYVLRKVPDALAREFMLTAESFSCEHAFRMGLIHFYGEKEETEDFIQSKLDFIVANGPGAVRATKRLLNFFEDHSREESRQEAIQVIANRRVSTEGQEGIKSFLEKRDPSWRKT